MKDIFQPFIPPASVMTGVGRMAELQEHEKERRVIDMGTAAAQD
jgi:hypothetical protein